MTKLRLLSSLAAFTLLSAGCIPGTAQFGDFSDPGPSPTPDEPVSEWDDNGYPTVVGAAVDYLGEGAGAEGDFLDAFELVDQDGETVDFRQFLGFVTVVDLGAEWCGPCNYMAESVQEVSDAMQEMGPSYYLTILAQDNDGAPADEDTAARWARTHDLSTPVLADDDQQWTRAWGIRSFPTLWIIAPTGEVVFRGAGVVADEQILAWVEYLLDEYAADLRAIDGWPSTSN